MEWKRTVAAAAAMKASSATLQVILVSMILWSTGCATWKRHDHEPVTAEYRAPAGIPIKAVEMRWRLKWVGTSMDTGGPDNLCAAYKVVYRNKKTAQGIISSDFSINREPVFLPPSGDPTSQYMSPSGPYPAAEQQRLQAQQDATVVAGGLFLIERGLDAVMSGRRYQKLKEMAREEIESFDVYVQLVNRGPGNSEMGNWQKGLQEAMQGMNLVTAAPPLIVGCDQRQRAREFARTLKADLPEATVHLPPSVEKTEQFLATLEPTDRILHLDITKSNDRNAALMALNGVFTFLTAAIIPWSFPERHELEARLEDRDGQVIACGKSTGRLSGIMGLPMLFFGFTEEHRFFKARKEFFAESNRIALKEVLEARPLSAQPVN